VLGHLLSSYGIYGSEYSNQFLAQNFGVTIFFILSGFLISYAINNRGLSYGFRNYFLDRFTRIFVALLPALFFVAILDLAAVSIFKQYEFQDKMSVKNFAGSILMLQDFPLFKVLSSYFNNPGLLVEAFGSARPLWTVAIEWWMYMAIGFFYYVKPTVSKWMLLPFLSIVPLYSLIAGGNVLSLVWLSGVVIFYLLKSQTLSPQISKMLLVTFLLGCVLRLRMNYNDVYELGFCVLLAGAFFSTVALFQNAHAKTGSPVLRWIADKLASYSFSLYLLHYSICVFISHLELELSVGLQILIAFLLSNLVAYFFAQLTELRYHQVRAYIKRRFPPKGPALRTFAGRTKVAEEV